MISNLLKFIKRCIFEEGRLIYYINIPRYRKRLCSISKQNKDKNEKIKVGFFCQLPDIWVSLKAVYEAALENPNIEPVLIAVPIMKYSYYIKVKEIEYKKVYDYANNISNEYIKSYDYENNKWLDLATLNLDYVFLPRPYETYLPKQYRASSLNKYTKVCYVPYATANVLMRDCCYNTHFIRNVYMIFCENEYMCKYVSKKLKENVKLKYQKVFDIGYPRFDLIEDKPSDARGIWKRDKSNSIKRLIWTPRWATTPELGGSNFLNYKDVILDYALNAEDDVDLVFRPHPMTFDAFMKAGLISKEEIDKYCEKIYQSTNCTYDHGSEFLNTFYESDVLISDESSIIIEYLFTGKPIIYCVAQETIDEIARDQMKCYYVVNNKEELIKVLDDLMNGNDPKQKDREEYIDKIKPKESISKRILKVIEDNYYGVEC